MTETSSKRKLLPRLAGFLRRVSDSRWFYPLALLALITRIVWKMWEWRDLTYGDTSSYFTGATRFFTHNDPSSLVFSPLYVQYYALFIHAFSDPFASNLLHRIGVIFMAGFSVYALFRTMMPRSVGWLVAAWWIVLPINWNALYEVHLFGVIPLALGCFAVGYGRNRLLWAGLGLALVWTGTLLVRNEFALTVALLTCCCLVREWWLLRKQKGKGRMLKFSRAVLLLAIPGLLVTALSAAYFSRVWPGWNTVRKEFAWRHELNIAQVYPFGYQQRHPEWKLSPWTEGHLLMKEHFRKQYLTFSEAYKRNPEAIRGHIAWNFQLLPAGLQLGMFDSHMGPHSPDFLPPRQNDQRAITLSIIAIVLLLGGAFCLWKKWPFYKRLCRERAVWCWVALFCMVPPCVVAVITQRPRPSYLFMLCILLMAMCGWSFVAVLRQMKLWRYFRVIAPLLTIAVVCLASPPKNTTQLYSGQPLLETYRIIEPFKPYFASKHTVFCSREFPTDVLHYLTADHPTKLKAEGLPTIPNTTAELSAYLDQKRINILLLRVVDLANPTVQEWLKTAPASGWLNLSQNFEAQNQWLLMHRKAIKAPPKNKAPKPAGETP